MPSAAGSEPGGGGVFFFERETAAIVCKPYRSGRARRQGAGVWNITPTLHTYMCARTFL